MNRKEKIYNFIKDNQLTPFTFNEIALMLGVNSDDMEEFDKLLHELLSEKKIILTKKKRYKYNRQNDLFQGVFTGHDKGFGFISCPEFDKDFFVSPSDKKNALNGDVVRFKILSDAEGDKRTLAAVVEIVERKNITVVGTYIKNKNFGFVIADDKKFDKDIYIPGKNRSTANDGDKVVCTILDYGKNGKNPEGIITEVLGDFFEDGNDVLSVIKKYELPYIFPPKVMKEVECISSGISEKELQDRVNLTEKMIITIDGADAKDLDDAISVEKNSDNTYTLGVHIADVSHYVKEGTSLDKEAYKRGTSVYLADRVVPMLPKELSNGICSLHPDVLRLTLSVFMKINNKGEIVDYDFVSSYIKSKYRLTYDFVTKVLEDNEGCPDELKMLLHNMKELALLLRCKRQKRGSLDFDFPECKIIYDENNFPVDIKRYSMTIANNIIEEFMLLANETVAEHIYWQNYPLIYRIHEQPDPDKIDKFKIFIKNMGYVFKVSHEEIHPKSYLDLLEKIKGDKNERIIQTVMLRSLMKAKYSPENKGHFGLASKFYCHFTSPIRRYPDLIVHRVLKDSITGKIDEARIDFFDAFISKASEHTSERERIAESAERDTVDIKKAEYMMEKIGEEFEGVISSVTNFGIFVELDNTVEGLVRYEYMRDDYYIYDDTNYIAIGERTGKKYKIGDGVMVRVIDSNPQLMEVDFQLIKKI
ncbi:MAG: ribonuclease R [Ruminococcaceae bacterium]|nr:ribonuclease R [Oscillospiraceae bacterium]